MKVLHVVPHARHCVMARELELLLAAPRTGSDKVSVCCLGGDGPAARKWQAVGVEALRLNWRRWLDPRPLWTLAAHVRAMQPDMVCSWGLSAVRAVRLAAPHFNGALIVRQPCHALGRGSARSAALSRLDRWLLSGAHRILASSSAEAAQCTASGISPNKVRVVPTGVRALSATVSSYACDSANGTPHMLCAGALEAGKGFYEAIWAFDFFGYLYDDIELTIVGQGPQRQRLERFARGTGLRHRIHLTGSVTDIAPWLARATVVWVPSLVDRGAGTTLEAMAAGKPVVAYRWPSLEELVVAGQTGYLVEPGNKMDLARQTRRLLDDADLRRRFGEAARRRAEQLYSPIMFVKSWRQACQESTMDQEAANRA